MLGQIYFRVGHSSSKIFHNADIIKIFDTVYNLSYPHMHGLEPNHIYTSRDQYTQMEKSYLYNNSQSPMCSIHKQSILSTYYNRYYRMYSIWTAVYTGSYYNSIYCEDALHNQSYMY